jgi:hypothetical protein
MAGCYGGGEVQDGHGKTKDGKVLNRTHPESSIIRT